MTTLPRSSTEEGFGRAALEQLLSWFQSKEFTNIQAVQVQPSSEGFWTSLGFEPVGNETNDFTLK